MNLLKTLLIVTFASQGLFASAQNRIVYKSVDGIEYRALLDQDRVETEDGENCAPCVVSEAPVFIASEYSNHTESPYTIKNAIAVVAYMGNLLFLNDSTDSVLVNLDSGDRSMVYKSVMD
ncbi:MAG: hypothetical protein AB8E15_08035 [Bdellovibrionales bacterium]